MPFPPVSLALLGLLAGDSEAAHELRLPPTFAAALIQFGRRLRALRDTRQLHTAAADALRDEFEVAVKRLFPDDAADLSDQLAQRSLPLSVRQLPGGPALESWLRTHGRRRARISPDHSSPDEGENPHRAVNDRNPGDGRGTSSAEETRRLEAEIERIHRLVSENTHYLANLDLPDFGEIEFRGASAKPPAASAPPAPAPAPASTPSGTSPVAGADASPRDPAERHIALWLDDEQEPPHAIEVGTPHLLHARVGALVQSSIVTAGDTAVGANDVPAAGLNTTWVMTSADIEFVEAAGVRVAPSSDGRAWTARFTLHIPVQGDSATVDLPIVARHMSADGVSRLEVSILVGDDLYRRLSAQLAVRAAGTTASLDAPVVPPLVHTDDTATPLRYVNPSTHHEWTSPPGTLQLIVATAGTEVVVTGTAATSLGTEQVDDDARWFGGDPLTRGRIDHVRQAAERLRGRAEGYLNDIDPTDLINRLAAFTPNYSWNGLTDTSDLAHQQAWNTVSTSVELRDLAVCGYRLYEGFFPQGNALRDRLDHLLPGHRLNIRWTRGTANWVSDVPWGLMFLKPPPAPGQPIDPMYFAGLRFRIGYVPQAGSAGRALGAVSATHHGHALYWDTDDIGREAEWQRTVWADWANQVFVPTPGAVDRRAEVLALLDLPSPGPMPVLYLFCTCTVVGAGTDPILRFANSTQPGDTLRSTDLPLSMLADRPLVFANACTTSGTDAYYANELAQSFLSRGCRAYLGTETKVPIAMASRFATVFFKFFYRAVDPAPLAAGEALAQARLFLWTSYRNIGGLFYTLQNQYDLFMATDDEVVRR